MVDEFTGIALNGEQLFDFRPIGRRRVLQRIVLAVERSGEHRRTGIRFVRGVQRAAELRRHDRGVADLLRRTARQRDRRFIGRMDGAEKVGRMQTGLVDPPEYSVGVDEIVGAPGLGRREPALVCQILAVADRWGFGGG